MSKIWQAILTLFGRGPVFQAIQAGVAGKLKDAEQKFASGQVALIAEFEQREADLLKSIASDMLKELTNGN